jgi:cardiolipin synthase C
MKRPRTCRPSAISIGRNRRRVGSAGGLVLLVALVSGCTVLPDKPTGTPSRAFTDTHDTTLGKLAATAADNDAFTAGDRGASGGTDSGKGASAAGDDRSAVCILDRGEEAFVTRVALLDLAERSVDVQTLTWSGDRTGRLLVAHLLRAADRGVRVRVLLDDLDVVGRDVDMALFDACPNVEVRLYNPFRYRMFTRLGRPLEFLTSLDRVDHRMHNKTFVVDNQAAVIGGRNIGDEYFGVDRKYNFRDFDLLAVGHRAAAQCSACFDAYWANARSYPVHDVAPHEFTAEEVRRARARLDAGVNADRAAFPYPLPGSRDEALRYVEAAVHSAVRAATEVLYDDPAKGTFDTEQPSHIREVLLRTPPTSEVLLLHAYFVPQQRLIDALVAQQSRGVRVRLLTNSLASTDVVAIHAGYAKCRARLLAAGMSISELRPDAEGRARLVAPDCRGAKLGLHGKVMVLDRRRVFVGSMNLDPRSHRLNTEDGMLIDSPELARRVAERLEVEFEPRNCWRLELMGARDLTWTTSRAGLPEVDTSEPGVSGCRTAWCDFLKLLPIENEL